MKRLLPFRQSFPTIFMKKIYLFLLLSALVLLSVPLFSNTKAAVPNGNFLELNGGWVLAKSASTFYPNSLSIEVWIKPDKTSGIASLVSIGNSTTKKADYEIGLNGNSFYLNYYYANNSYRSITTGNLSSNLWQHVAVTISAEQTSMFINGHKIYSTQGGNPLNPINDSIMVGNSLSAGIYNNRLFYGAIDQLRISQSPVDVESLWNNNTYQGQLTSDANTLLLWQFDQTRGDSAVIDSSLLAINGQLIGGDLKIHFYGILPSPTAFVLPTLRPLRPIFFNPRPTENTIEPTQAVFPTPDSFSRLNRPVFSR